MVFLRFFYDFFVNVILLLINFVYLISDIEQPLTRGNLIKPTDLCPK
jgi:hypothetical protein